MEKSFLQSEEWGKFQENLGMKVYGGEKFVAILEEGRFSKRLFCPYGPTDLKKNLGELKKAAEETGVDFVRVEPRGGIREEELKELGFRRAATEVNPIETIVNDLSGGGEAILAGVSQGVRRVWRKLEKIGVEYEVSMDEKDMEDFIGMLHDTVGRTELKGHSDEYYRKFATSLFPTGKAGLMFAKLEGRRVAGVVWTEYEGIMSYLYAANLGEFRKESPATGLGLFTMLEAEKRGCKKFDWFGVAPEGDKRARYKSWAGFTQFKLGFGGERVRYLGTWELPVRKGRYLVYRGLLKLGLK